MMMIKRTCLTITLMSLMVGSVYAERSGFVSYFHKVAYDVFAKEEALNQQREEQRRLDEERLRREAEIKRREEERRLMEQQVVKVEDFKDAKKEEREKTKQQQALDSLDDPLASLGITDQGQEEAPPTYLLQGVVVSDSWQQAIINGKVYRVGDKIDNESTVAEIQKNSVSIRFKETLVDVPVPMMKVTTKALDDDLSKLGLGNVGGPASTVGDSGNQHMNNSVMNMKVHE